MAPIASYALVPSLLLATGLALEAQPVDSLERVIRREMARREIPGLSIAVIDSGRIVFARGYGVTRRGGPPVSDSTLFQAGSISKAVTAVGAMRLVSRGTLALDRDINQQLVSWKLRDTSVAEGEKVTVRQLLSHSAGLNVHGFPGYALTERMPTAIQVLNGEAPTNTAAIRIERKPGARWQYSGGGYTILQVLMSDVSARPFDALMQDEVLTPAGMTASTFAQPLPATHAPRAATGTYPDGKEVVGGWHSYPEMAAAGLWTTPSDLARFAIAVQHAFRREPNGILPADVADEMLSYQRNDFMGLGLFLKGNNVKLEFSHGGRDEGFDASLSATALSRQGVVIMINANDNSGAVERIRTLVANLWQWPSVRPAPLPPRAVAIPSDALTAVTGRYEVRNNVMMGFEGIDGRLYSTADGKPDEEFIPVGEDLFTKSDGSVTFRFTRNAAGAVTGFDVRNADGSGRAIPRIGPLSSQLVQRPDPDRARTARLTTLLRGMGAGKASEFSAMLAPGALRDFSGQNIRELTGVANIRYLGEEDIKGRGIVRHEGAVDRIIYVSATIDAAPRTILIHLTSAGLVTDYDVVRR